MKEYKLKTALQNNLLLNRIKEAGFQTTKQFSVVSGISYPQIGQVINLKTTMYNYKFELRNIAIRLAEYFRCEPRDLFPEEVWYEALEENKAEVELSASDAQLLLSRPPTQEEAMRLVDIGKMVSAATDMLTDREKKVIDMRYNKDMHLYQCGEALGVSTERIRQIEHKALRKMRHPEAFGGEEEQEEARQLLEAVE